MGLVRKLFTLALLIAVGTSAPGVEGLRPRVAVLPVQNLTGEPAYDALMQTMGETIALVLRLLGEYEVVDYDTPDTDILIREYDAASLAELAEDEGVEDVIFGAGDRDDAGRLRFTLSLFDTASGEVTVTRSETAFTIFDVFDAADEIVAAMLSEFSDIRIAYGSVELVRDGLPGRYTVYLDETVIRNPDRMLQRILNGAYVLSIIQDRLGGPTVIFSRDILVLEGQITRVEFTIPPASPEEFELLESFAESLEQAAGEPGQLEGLLAGIAEFQRATILADYDSSLAERRDALVAAAGSSAMQQLTEVERSGDELFYGRRPDFSQALEVYGPAARLINDVYRYDEVAASVHEPVAVAMLPDRSILVLDAINPTVLLRTDAQGREMASVVVDQPPDIGIAGALHVEPGNRVYYLSLDGRRILVFDHALNQRETIVIPDGPVLSAGMTVDASGMIYVIGRDGVRVFDVGGERDEYLEEAVRTSLLESGIVPRETSASSSLQVLSDHTGSIAVFSGVDGTLARMTSSGELLSTTRIQDAEPVSRCAIDSMGTIYVTLPTRHRIATYSRQGQIINTYGSLGYDPGQFSAPTGVWVDEDGLVVIADTFNQRIQTMTPTAPPVLVPEVANMGIRFSHRIDRSQAAIREVHTARSGLRPWRIVANIALSVGSVGGGALLGGLADIAAEEAYERYQQATTTEDAMDYREIATRQWYLGMSAAGAATLGGAFLTSAILTSFELVTARPRATRNIQAFSMDDAYELDRERYRSLRTSRRIGFWTGVAPPLLAGPVALASFVIDPDPEPEWYNGASIAASAVAVAVPPILGNAYAGRFHVGLAVTGLLSNGLMASGYYIRSVRDDAFVARELTGVSTTHWSYAPLSAIWRSLQQHAPLYLASAAVGIRFTAGLYDTRRAWIEARNTNLFRAIRPVQKPDSESTASGFAPGHVVALYPVLDVRRGVGFRVVARF